MNCTDWKKIKKEYIAGGTSYRKLAEKYDAPFGTLRKIAAKEKWRELRDEARAKADTIIVNTISDQNAKVESKVIKIADQLLDVMGASIERIAEKLGAIDSQSLKQYTSALKDLKDIKGYKTELDLKEQKARIANLEKQAEVGVSKDIEVTVRFEDDSLDEYSK